MSAVGERIRNALHGEIVLLAVLIGVVVASVVWHPSDEGGFVFCPFRRATGWPCPGCGLTRSFCALAKGHVAQSFAFHALGPVAFGLVCVWIVRSAAAIAGRRSAVAAFDAAVSRWKLVHIGVVALLVAWVVRLVELGTSGQLSTLAHDGELFRFFF